MSTVEKVEAIRSREMTAAENVEEKLDRLEEVNDDINAYIEANPGAMEEAKKVDRKIEKGEEVGKLAGLGIGIKTNINTKGLRATCASKTLKDHISTYDAEVTRRIRDADGIVLGMTNMDEFACGSSGETSAFGPTQNPAAKGRIPGGSSSGSSAPWRQGPVTSRSGRTLAVR